MEGHFSRRDPLRRVPAAVLFAALSLLIAVLIGLGTAATASAQAPVPGKLTVQRGGLTVAATSSGMNTTGAAAVSDDCSAGDGVCLYEHTSFGGRWVRFVGTGCYADFSQIGFNDLASSLRFTSNYGGGRYSVVLYEHAYFGGIYSGFGTDDLNFSNNEIGHDRASSICIDTVPQCTGDGVYLYEHTNYAGRCRKFTENNDNFRPTGFNDVASSVRLVGAFGGGSRKVTLCEHSGYGGACSAFSGDDPDLRDDVVGNDRTSSLRIEASTGTACPPITDWKGEYWNNKTLSGSPVLCRNDANVNFEWGAGGPGGGISSDNFSARWTRDWNFAGGRYRFHLRGDDGIRLWLDGNLIIDQWKDQARTEYSVERDLTAGSHNLRVEYYENTGDASVALWWETTSGTCPTFRGDYFNNTTLSGSPAFTVFEKCPIDLTWGQNGPGGGIGNDRFSVRWTGRAHFNAGTYTFIARADDGIRAWVNNTLIIDEWRDQAATEFRRTLTLTAGDYDIRVEYYENAGNAVAQFRWEQAAAATGVVKSDKPAFDTCRLPLVSEMRDWWSNSPYYEANIYLGGVNRSCKDWNQQNLTPSWVQAVHSQGWNFIPTWVGPQAPCNTSGLAAMSGDAGAAFNQGRAEADAAVNAAKAVGLTSLGSGQTVIYYAMAPYPNNASCRNTVKSFMSGWSGRLRELGMRSGGYGASCASYVSDWATTANVPDNVWAATANWPAYDPSVTVWNVGGCLSNSLWTNRQRIFQYTPGHNEWWGSTTLNIDSNIAGGDVAGTHVRLAGSAAAAAAAPGVAGPASGEIVAAELVTADEGWVLTGDRLLWSADRGTRWTDITPAGVASPRMAGAAFVDSQRGWVVFSGRAAEGLLVARTADGGRNWSITPLAGAGADAGDVSLSFADAATGWISVRLASGSAFSVAALFGTRDGGATWAPLTVPVAGPIRFISAMTGWVAGGSAGDELYVTRDGGRSWQPQPGLPRSAPGSAQFLYGLPSFENAAEGVIPVTVAEAARPRVEYYRTGDGGASWQLAAEVALQRRPAAAASTAILGGRRLMAVDPGSGTLQMVEPDGRLRRSAPSTGLQDGAEVDFATPEVGWAVRRYGSCQGDKDNPTAAQPFTCEQHADLLRTVDGGATWEVLRP